MAYGSELILGWVGADIERPLKLLGLSLEDDTQLELEGLKALSPAIARAHEEALRSAGFTDIHRKSVYAPTQMLFGTPPGGTKPREFWPWTLDIHYDPGEMGETETQRVLGVSLTGRYWASFADWDNGEERVGGFNPMVFSPEMHRRVEIARLALANAGLDAFATALPMVKEKHY